MDTGVEMKRNVLKMHLPHPHDMSSRRSVLRGAGVALALPWLECLAGRGRGVGATREQADASPHRLLAIETTMGLLPQYFFPTTVGRTYAPTAYLRHLEPFRDRLTVFSGVSHPIVLRELKRNGYPIRQTVDSKNRIKFRLKHKQGGLIGLPTPKLTPRQKERRQAQIRSRQKQEDKKKAKTAGNLCPRARILATSL